MSRSPRGGATWFPRAQAHRYLFLDCSLEGVGFDDELVRTALRRWHHNDDLDPDIYDRARRRVVAIDERWGRHFRHDA